MSSDHMKKTRLYGYDSHFSVDYDNTDVLDIKYLQSDWLRGVQYWPCLHSVFNICTL